VEKKRKERKTLVQKYKFERGKCINERGKEGRDRSIRKDCRTGADLPKKEVSSKYT